MGTPLALANLVAGNLPCLKCLLRLCGYIDPGTGSLLIQVLMGVLFGGLFALKLGWRSVKVFFSQLLSKRKDGSRDHV